MKLTASDYDILIKNTVAQITVFARSDGTSISYEYLKSVCTRIIEITNEYQKEYPKEASRYSDGGG